MERKMRTRELNCTTGDIQIYDNPANDVKHVLVICHGITYSYEAVYAYKIDGKSIVDMLNVLGISVIGFDFAGFGKSMLTKGMMINSEVAVLNLQEVISFVKEHYDGAAITIMGWSWGAQIVGKYATRYPRSVDKIILYGLPCHINKNKLLKVNGDIRENTMEHAKSDFSCNETIVSTDVVNDFAENAIRINPYSYNSPIYELSTVDYLVEPAKIVDPVLVIHGNEDERIDIIDETKFFMEIKSKHKTHVSYQGGHSLHLEKYRDKFCAILAMFIKE